MKTEIETSTYLSVTLSEEDKETLKKAKDIINDICAIAGNCGTVILPGNGDEILLSEILETLEEIEYFVEMVDGKQVEIIPY